MEMQVNKLLRLYIVGDTASAKNAVLSIQQNLVELFDDGWELEVIDVLERPELVEEDLITAVPALIKKIPPPKRRYVGDLDKRDKMLMCLELTTA
jgi:circadian clock protein KaiB